MLLTDQEALEKAQKKNPGVDLTDPDPINLDLVDTRGSDDVPAEVEL